MDNLNNVDWCFSALNGADRLKKRVEAIEEKLKMVSVKEVDHGFEVSLLGKRGRSLNISVPYVERF